jgi:hypothetical protein
MYYQKLFNHMNEEHGLILLQTEMDAIISVVNEIQTEALRQSCVGGRSEQLICPFCQSDDLFEFELKHSKCRKCKEQWTN